MTIPRKLPLLIFAAAIAFFAFAHGVFAAQAGGVVISNRASVTYTDEGTGQTFTLQSDAVLVFVAAAESLSLTQSQTKELPPGSTVGFSHRLTNTGSVPASYTLSLENAPGDDFDIDGLVLYHDLNGDGQVDAGEPLVLPAQPIALAPGLSADFVVQGAVAGATALGQTARVALTATSAVQGVTATNTDTIRTVEGVKLTVTKTASTLTPAAGSDVTFTVAARNDGTYHAIGTSIIVDGTENTYVFIRDTIPPNTVLKSIAPPPGGKRLYHLFGEPQDTYRSTPPLDLATVDAVGYAVDVVPAGGQIAFSFIATINNTASGKVSNTARARYREPSGGVVKENDSNTVDLNVQGIAPTIAYYTDQTFVKTTNVTRLGSPLHVQVEASVCNRDAFAAETITVQIISRLTGDVETYPAVETGPNTGIFRVLFPVPTADQTLNPTNPGNGILEVLANDTLTAVVSTQFTGGAAISSTVLIDPFGVVFDSRSNAVLAGAQVTLIDVTGGGNGGNAGGPATVFMEDGVTPAPSVVITGADGRFQFPRVGPSTYRLDIAPPGVYSFPSVVPVGLLPAGRVIDASGSYGKSFVILVGSGAFQADIPLDTPPPSGFFIEKTAARQNADLGDFLDYSVKVSNNSDTALGDVKLADRLPTGFSYVPGSATRNGAALADPAGGKGPDLTFSLGNMAKGDTATVVYRVRIGPGTSLGANRNLAQARGTYPMGILPSNTASAEVKVRAGVFSDKGVIFGKVFVDGNGNGIQDRGEQGIPGVRLYLDDGTFVITDSEGKYSLYGISARAHALRVDRTTLPAGATMAPLTNRHGRDGLSCFVDLMKGELHKTNFAVESPSESVLAEVKARREKGDVFQAETDAALRAQLSPDGRPVEPGDVKAKPASGLVSGGNNAPRFDSILDGAAVTSGNANVPEAPVAATPSISMEQLLPGLDNELAFVNLADGDTLPAAQSAILVKGKMGSHFRLMLNGKEIPGSRIGRKAKLPEKSLEVWEFVGVDMAPGKNALDVVMVDPFGNERGRCALTVTAPGALARLVVTVPKKGVPADGRSAAEVVVKLTDENGVPVTARTPLTLEATLGVWQAKDLDPKEPGVQIFLTGGERALALQSPQEPGDADLRISSGALEGRGKVSFVPELRDMIVVGVVDGVLSFRGVASDGILPSRLESLLEDEVQTLRDPSTGGAARAGIRGSVFAKGRVFDDCLLTVEYDSEKEMRGRLFRDIQPDEYYPVYGDSSLRGFDGQSTSPLYARLDRGKSYLLYGDFTTANPTEASGLGTYYRSATGVKGHLESEWLSVNGYASRDNLRQLVQELPANGTSGPYALNNAALVMNSERVEILTRDRNQPSVVLKTEAKTRFTDYVIDAVSGGILFKFPIPSLDENLNPISVRVTSEVEQGGAHFWMYGGDATVKLGNSLEIGGTWAKDENPQDPMDIASAHASLRLGPGTVLLGEIAETSHAATGRGAGRRVELRHQDDRFTARAYAGETDRNFNNPTSILTAGRSEAGLKATWRASAKTMFFAEAISTKDVTSGGIRTGYHAGLERALSATTKVELAVRHANETTAAAQNTSLGATPVDFTSVRAKLSTQALKNVNVFGEYEQDLKDSRKQALALGGDWQFANRGRLYARHEFTSTLSGRYALNDVQGQNVTLVGVDTDYMKGGRLFSEYRVRDAFSGREAEAAMGLRNTWEIGKGVSVSTSLERIVRGAGGNTSAVTAGFAFTGSDRWKGTTQLEMRTGDTADSFLGTAGLALKLNDDLTLIGRDVYTISKGKGNLAGETIQHRLLIGMAFRPVKDDRWNGLAKYEYRFEKSDTAPAVRRGVNIFSANVNYQPTRKLTLGALYAGKYVDETSRGFQSASTAHMVAGRVTYDLSDRWDIGVAGARLFNPGESGEQYALGVEAGYLLWRDFWLSFGYNVIGFTDDDLAGTNYTARGPYIRLRMKLGEEMLTGAKSGK